MSINLSEIGVELATIASTLWHAGKLNPEARALERIVKTLESIGAGTDSASTDAAIADELGAEVARLQDALAFWMPLVPTEQGPIFDRIANDTYLLNGCDGNLPDGKSAQELGWIVVVDSVG